MATTPIQQIMSQALQTSAEGLFTHYALPLDPGEAGNLNMAAVLGFSSDKVQGAVGLLATEPVVEHTFENATGVKGDRRDVEDWLGELSNQLLGRIKIELLRYDINIYLATPVVLRGVELNVGGSQEDGVYKASFTSEKGGLCVWVDARHEPDLALEEIPQEEEVSEEGDGLFFF